jgi:hypothetical protein
MGIGTLLVYRPEISLEKVSTKATAQHNELKFKTRAIG